MAARLGFLLLTLWAGAAQAQIALCEPAPVYPADCNNATLPPGAPDPYIPAPAMCRTGTATIWIQSCVITARNPPADNTWCVHANWGVFAPDAATRYGRLIATGGQSPCLPPPGPKAAAVRDKPTVLQTAVGISNIPPADLAVASPIVLVQTEIPIALHGDWVHAGLHTFSFMAQTAPK